MNTSDCVVIMPVASSTQDDSEKGRKIIDSTVNHLHDYNLNTTVKSTLQNCMSPASLPYLLQDQGHGSGLTQSP